MTNFSDLAAQQQERAEELIHQFSVSANSAELCREAFFQTSEVSADNAGWLWSRETDADLRAGNTSQEILFYHELVVDKELLSDFVAHYQQTIIYQDHTFRLLEQVWFSHEPNDNRVMGGYFLACLLGAIIVAVWFSLRN